MILFSIVQYEEGWRAMVNSIRVLEAILESWRPLILRQGSAIEVDGRYKQLLYVTKVSGGSNA